MADGWVCFGCGGAVSAPLTKCECGWMVAQSAAAAADQQGWASRLPEDWDTRLAAAREEAQRTGSLAPFRPLVDELREASRRPP